MFKMEVIKLYAEEKNMSYQVASEIATPYELFDCYLRNEGIIGYTQEIVTTFRECFLECSYIYRVAYTNDEEDCRMQYIETIAKSAQDAANYVRNTASNTEGLRIKMIWKQLRTGGYIAVNAWN